jgi:hypothetical protein
LEWVVFGRLHCRKYSKGRAENGCLMQCLEATHGPVVGTGVHGTFWVREKGGRKMEEGAQGHFMREAV